MGTAFGANGAATAPAATTITAPYMSQSITGNVQWEAIAQARGWDDALRIETSIALSSLIKSDELLTLGGNAAALPAVVPAGVPSTATAVNTFGVGNWTIHVTALTLQGALANASSNSNIGESDKVACTVVVPGGDCDFLDISWPIVPGAVGYKVYANIAAAGGAGATYLCIPAVNLRYRKVTAGATDLALFGDRIVTPAGQTYVTVNHVQYDILTLNTNPAPPAADLTASLLQFEGLIPWCEKTTMYATAGLTHPNVDLNGAPLTTSGAGVLEIDQVLENLWTQWVISPTKIIASPKSVTSLSNHIIAANNGSMYRLEMSQERGKLVGGVFIGGYINKFAASLTNQRSDVSVIAHPYMPDGKFIFLSEDVPYQYSQTGKSFAMDVQTPYTYWELGRTTRNIPFDVFFSEVLKCYHPGAQAAISGVRVDA